MEKISSILQPFKEKWIFTGFFISILNLYIAENIFISKIGSPFEALLIFALSEVTCFLFKGVKYFKKFDINKEEVTQVKNQEELALGTNKSIKMKHNVALVFLEIFIYLFKFFKIFIISHFTTQLLWEKSKDMNENAKKYWPSELLIPEINFHYMTSMTGSIFMVLLASCYLTKKMNKKASLYKIGIIITSIGILLYSFRYAFVIDTYVTFPILIISDLTLTLKNYTEYKFIKNEYYSPFGIILREGVIGLIITGLAYLIKDHIYNEVVDPKITLPIMIIIWVYYYISSLFTYLFLLLIIRDHNPTYRAPLESSACIILIILPLIRDIRKFSISMILPLFIIIGLLSINTIFNYLYTGLIKFEKNKEVIKIEDTQIKEELISN